MKPLIFFGVMVLLFLSCQRKQEYTKEQWKEEVFKTEKDFETMVAQKGIHDAFVTFAAEDVVILRNDSLIRGRKALGDFYKNRNKGGSKFVLTWKPEYVDVAASGDLAYTYGKYRYNITDSLGRKEIYTGVFHTVWKRQRDNSWKFVWD